ncbi:MAG: hypothetical protein R3D88_00045 [Alphaproteobacteria bacterium]
METTIFFCWARVDPVVLSHFGGDKKCNRPYTQLEGSYSGLQITVTMIFVMVTLYVLLCSDVGWNCPVQQLVTPIYPYFCFRQGEGGGSHRPRSQARSRLKNLTMWRSHSTRMTARIAATA